MERPTASNLVDEKWDHGSTDGEIFVVIRDGLPDLYMDPWEGRITEENMWHVINYLRSIAPKVPKTP